MEELLAELWKAFTEIAFLLVVIVPILLFAVLADKRDRRKPTIVPRAKDNRTKYLRKKYGID